MSLPEQREKPAILNDVWRRLRGRLSGHHSTLSSTAFGDTRPRDYVLSAPLQPSACHANCDFSCPTTRQTHSLFSPLLSPLFLHFFFPSFPSLPLSLFFVVVVVFPSFPSFGLMIRSQIVPISLSFDEMALGNCFYDSTRFFEIFENSSSFVGKRYTNTKSEGISLILLLRFLKLSLVSYSILHRDAYTLLLLIPTQMIASGRHTYRNAIIDAIPSFIGSVRYLDSFKTYGTKARSFLNIRALPNNSTFHLFNVNASFAHIAENFQRKTILPSNYSSLSILIFVNKSYLLAPKQRHETHAENILIS